MNTATITDITDNTVTIRTYYDDVISLRINNDKILQQLHTWMLDNNEVVVEILVCDDVITIQRQ